ncbi:PIG-L deacetylase family protein [Streptomyces antimicrobicus]|uniref:PIG-L family deacetylase n=1 Tax=Streptomyces antimicrobicus TaxID=2883108 RepID=A0ABS8BCE5_9ACTN|nr:PIG-L family deacetylase [Streptomyces antimicrobicus]MCB5182315.1 PIG-L family deacetylase [Streptomyces antimicrobicus]
MTAPSILAVYAHPDDESLAAGGVLARHAAAGARTGVVTTTWAANSPRAAELADALQALGAESPRMLGYADFRVPASAPGRPRFCDAPLDEAVEHLVRHVRSFRPDLIVSHDAYGSSGHPDHIHTHRVMLLAAHAAGLEDLYPQAGPAWQAAAVYLSAHPRSAGAALARLLAGVGKRLYTVPDERISAAVDVRPWLDRKWQAIEAHRSEVARGRSLPALLSTLSAADRAAILGTEYYIRHELAPTRRGLHAL